MRIPINDPSYIDSKTKELLLYIANKLKDKPNYGATVLNKALYFIDCVSYLKTGKPISSFSYIKQDYGPTPKPSQFLSLKDHLEESGDLQVISVECFGYPQKRYIPTRPSKIDEFKIEEVVLIDEILGAICDISAKDLSDFSHSLIAWQFARNYEELPFATYLLRTKPATENDRNWAKSAIEKRGALSYS